LLYVTVQLKHPPSVSAWNLYLRDFNNLSTNFAEKEEKSKATHLNTHQQGHDHTELHPMQIIIYDHQNRNKISKILILKDRALLDGATVLMPAAFLLPSAGFCLTPPSNTSHMCAKVITAFLSCIPFLNALKSWLHNKCLSAKDLYPVNATTAIIQIGKRRGV